MYRKTQILYSAITLLVIIIVINFFLVAKPAFLYASNLSFVAAFFGVEGFKNIVGVFSLSFFHTWGQSTQRWSFCSCFNFFCFFCFFCHYISFSLIFTILLRTFVSTIYLRFVCALANSFLVRMLSILLFEFSLLLRF